MPDVFSCPSPERASHWCLLKPVARERAGDCQRNHSVRSERLSLKDCFFSPIRRTDVFEVCMICLTTLRAQYIARSMNRRHWAFMASLGQVCSPKTSITSIRACFKVWWRFGCVCLMVVWWGGSVLDGWIVVVCFWIGGVLDDILVVVVGSLLSW